MQRVKKAFRRLFSMKMAIALLGLMIAACVAGSLIQQGKPQAYYIGSYSEKAAWLILLLKLNDVFHSAWFIALTALLCLNLLGCNLVRFPRIWRRMRGGFSAEKRLDGWDRERAIAIPAAPDRLFERMGFRKLERGSCGGAAYVYAARNRLGLWGAWLTHLGLLLIIVGFALGQIFMEQHTVYGVAGQTKPVEGTDYALTIDDFQIDLRADETVEQYTSRLTMTDTTTGEQQSGMASVNEPLALFGMKVYQNSTGWAANVRIFKNDVEIQNAVLCAGESLAVEDKPGLAILFNAFYPDYVPTAEGKPATASARLKNPAYLYTVYYNSMVIGMNVLIDDYITIDEYSVFFEDPQSYTLLQLKRDPFTRLAAIGGIVILLAILLAFYLRTEEIWAVEEADGGWLVDGYSKKGGILFRETLLKRAKECFGEEK